MALIAGMFAHVGPAAAQDPAGRVVLVLDSSLAMQGALGNETKLEAAKGAVDGLLPRFEGRLDLGLLAYGSRKAKACADVALLSPPQGLKAVKLSSKLASLKPVGSSPLGQALTDAATALGPAGPRDRILLIAGGPDSCEADPCAIAKQAKAERNIRIDVIAVRGPEEDLKDLRCVSKLTGGAHYEVVNAGKLLAALDKVLGGSALPDAGAEQAAAATGTEGGEAGTDQPLSLEPGGGEAEVAEGGDVAASTATTVPLPAEDPDNAVTADGKVPMLFSALLADPGPAIDSGLTWRVYEGKAGSDGLNKLLTRSEDAAPRVPLAPGDYLVNVAYGRAYMTRAIKVEPDRPARELFVLNAGGLRLSAKTADGQAIATGAVVNDIYSEERDQAGNRALVVAGIKSGLILRLNAGLYHVKSTYGDANGVVSGDISIEAGRLTELTLTHEAANVTFKLVTESGGEALAGVQWRISAPDGAVVRESAGALPTHILAPGRYNIEASRGGEKYAGAFEVEAGKARTVEVVVPVQ